MLTGLAAAWPHADALLAAGHQTLELWADDKLHHLDRQAGSHDQRLKRAIVRAMSGLSRRQ